MRTQNRFFTKRIIIVFCYCMHVALTNSVYADSSSIYLTDIKSINKSELDKLLEENKANTRALIRLNDEQTIKATVNRYKDSGGRDRFAKQQLMDSSAPWIIDNISQILYFDDKWHYRSWQSDSMEFSDYGISYETASIIRRIILESPEFKQELKDWAIGLEDSTDKMESLNRVFYGIRVFWEQNKEHFESERYDLVQPPILDDSPSKIEEQAEEIEVPNLVLPESELAEVEVVDEPDETMPALPSTEAEPKQGLPAWAIWLGGILLILAVIGFALRSRK